MFLKSKRFSFRPKSLLFDLRSLSFLTSSKIPCDNVFFWIFWFGKCGQIIGSMNIFFLFHPYLKTTVIYQDFLYLPGFTILLGITFKPEQDLLTVVFQGPKEAVIGLLFGIAWALLVTLFPGKNLRILGLLERLYLLCKQDYILQCFHTFFCTLMIKTLQGFKF